MIQPFNYQNTIDQVFLLINEIRLNPKSFIPYLKQKISNYNNLLYTNPHTNQIIKTKQGTKAVQQAIQQLQNQNPLPKLSWSYCLHLAADLHTADMGKSGEFGNIGSDGSTMVQRVQRFTQWYGHLAQNQQLGSSTPQQIVSSMLIDDGLFSRGHRKNLLSKEIHYVGIAMNSHSKFNFITVVTLAQDVQIKEEAPNQDKKGIGIHNEKGQHEQVNESIQQQKRSQALKELQKQNPKIKASQQESNCYII